MHGRGRVADVLRALEDTEGQAGEEVPRRQQASHRPELEAGPVWNSAYCLCRGARPTGCAGVPHSQHGQQKHRCWKLKGFCCAKRNLFAPAREQNLLFRCSVGSFDYELDLRLQPTVFSCSAHHLGSTPSSVVNAKASTSSPPKSQFTHSSLHFGFPSCSCPHRAGAPVDPGPGSPGLAPTFQEAGDLLQLRDVVLIVATEFLQ